MTVRYMCTHSLSKILTKGLIKPFRRIFICDILQQMSQNLGPPFPFLYSQIAYFIPMTDCGSAQNLRMPWFNFFVTGLKTEKVCYRCVITHERTAKRWQWNKALNSTLKTHVLPSKTRYWRKDNRQKKREDEEEEVINYWMALRNRKDTGNWKSRH